MKFVKCLLCVLVLSLSVTACSNKPHGDPMPMYFDSEEQFVSAIDEVKSKKNNEDDAVVVTSKTAHDQQYSAKSDMYNLSTISEFYKPGDILKGTTLKEIHVKHQYVSYHYVSEDQIESATFTWMRLVSPDADMNALNDLGASVQKIERNDIKYVFLGWADPETHKPSGYTVFWVYNGKVYQADVMEGYTVDEILEFCKVVTVRVK